MNKAIKTKWLKALRSGKYKQAKGALCPIDEKGKIKGFCCLGVLTDLYIKDYNKSHVKKISWEEDVSGSRKNLFKEGGMTPRRVVIWAGLKKRNPSVSTKNSPSVSLAVLNDGVGYGFKKIANIIEKQL